MNQAAIGYAVSALLGAFVVTLAGFFIYSTSHPGISFGYWTAHPFIHGASGWFVVGLFVGSAIRWLAVSR